jgi:tetratricopeptide (TPR) repeat protein
MVKPISIRDVNGNVTVTIVEGTGNEVKVSVDDFAKQMQQKCGFRLIHKDIFKGSEKKHDQAWLRGFSYSLASIYNGLEYRRKKLLDDIKAKLEDKHCLLLLGESGTSKSTILMEILCDYLRQGYKILYNLEVGDGKIDNVELVEDTINILVNSGDRVAIVVDNTQRNDVSLIFSIIKKYMDDDDVIRQKKIKFVLSARQPEFKWAIERGIFASEVIEKIEVLFDKERRFPLPWFSEDEIKGFIQHYKDYIIPSIRNVPLDLIARNVHKYTSGHPIMVRFSLLQNGLKNHVQNAYREYLLENNKPSIERIEFVLACSLYDVSSIPFTDDVSIKLNLNPSLQIVDTIIKKNGNCWNTIHPRWDLELFKYMFSLNYVDFNAIKNSLSIMINKILEVELESAHKMALLNTMYNTIAASPERYMDIKIIEDILSKDCLKKIFDKNSDKSILFALIIGVAYDQLKDYKNSVDFYDEAISLNSNNADAYYNKGTVLLNLRRYEEAVKCYDEAIGLKPDYATAHGNKGTALYRLGRYEDAIGCYDEIIRLKPDDAYAHINKGLALSMLGSIEEAIKCYDEAIRLKPDDIEGYNGKGLALLGIERYEEAIGCYQKTLNLDNNNITALVNMAYSLIQLNRRTEAKPLIDKVRLMDPNNEFLLKLQKHSLIVDPNDAGALYNKGLALHTLGKYQEAIECYDKYLKINPDDTDALNNKGLALNSLAKYQEAIECYDNALKINPDDTDALNNKGSALHTLGKYEEAIDHFDKALKIDPDFAVAFYNKGLALNSLAKYQEAIECFDKALKINPDDAYAFYNKGLALNSLAKYQEAIECYDNALKINPDYALSWNAKGVTLSKLNKIEEAVQYSDKAIDLDPSYANAWYKRACYMAIKIEINEALKSLQEAVRLDNTYLESAKSDKEFDNIRNDDRFRKLTGN